MKALSILKEKWLFIIASVRRCFQPLQEKIKEDNEIDVGFIAQELKQIEYTIVIVEIVFNDGFVLSYNQKHKKEKNVTYIDCYYDLYKWFFFRKHSEWFSFRHKEGTKIFKRSDIKRITFDHKYEAENVV